MRLFDSAVRVKLTGSPLRRDALASFFFIISFEARPVQESFPSLGSEFNPDLGITFPRIHQRVRAAQVAA